MSARKHSGAARARKGQQAEPTYALGAVVRLVGISEHTLRAWERRHGVVEPRRTAGGTRRYTEADIERLRLLRRAVDAGHPIRELAPLDDAAIEARLDPGTLEREPPEDVLAALARMDPGEAERKLGFQLAALGPRDFALEVALPLLREIGDRWEDGRVSIAEEHAASASLRSLLGAALRSGRKPNGSGPVLLATLEGERHELGTLVAAICAQDAGARVDYLGPDLPPTEVAEAARQARAAAVAVGSVVLEGAELRDQLRDLRRALPSRIALWTGGPGIVGLRASRGIRLLESMKALETCVRMLDAEASPA